MIDMFCDRCGEKIPPETNGGARVRTGNREQSFHLCTEHQQDLRVMIADFCTENAPRDVNPSLSKS